MTKTYQQGDYVATHERPVWRDRANFIIRICLGEKNGRNEWEQLWAQRTGEKRFLICCVPFFAFDISLGDEVETDSAHAVTRVVNPSGHHTFRVWFGASKESDVREEIFFAVRQLGCETEWSSQNLLGVDAANSDIAQIAADFLFENEKQGRITYETGKTG